MEHQISLPSPLKPHHMKNGLLITACFLMSMSINAQVNFSEHIAPIVYNHCTKCHRAGEIGPFPLTNYEEVADHGNSIAYATEIRYMPPWRPDPNFRHFMGENVLTDEQIAMIQEWVDNDMPQGDPNLEPPLPTFPDGSQVGVPDLVLTMDQQYLHYGTDSDQYQIFVLPTGLTEDHDIEAIEVRADNNEICHHAILGVDTSGFASTLDAQDLEYGYTQFGGFGFEPVDQFFSAWVPGAAPLIYPPTIGKRLYANSDILLQMHYGPSSIDQYDQTSVNIFFSDDPIQRYVQTYPINPADLDTPFLIPPGQVVTFHGTVDVPAAVSLIGIAPHAHLLGSSYKVFAVSPSQQDTINLIHIPEWNFNWQGLYAFPNMIHIPAGYTIHCYGTFDNTTDNPLNPNDPPIWVTWGEGTEDEMYLCYIQYVLYQNGDENISLAAPDVNDYMVYPVNQLFPSYPNPANNAFTIGYSLASAESVDIGIYDMQGRLVHTHMTGVQRTPGKHKETIDVSKLAPGMYVYTLQAGKFRQSQQLVID